MTYQVLARKWRPQAFDAVVGQDPVTRTLRNALVSGRVAHAYLFTGPRGVGKTTSARLLAKALCCTARTGPEACSACPSCADFVSGAPVDVMEIDAASNTSVDDIRTLRDNVKYAPARSRFKVYIIDEVHMLSGAAFNAFLKTLEEPPAHVVFILATTDPKKIPATVLSRCQRFDFKPIAPEALTESLTAILEKEGVPFERSALPLLVRASEGSLRDALSLLDTAIAYGEGRLDEAAVAQLLGSASPVHVRGFLSAMLTRDAAAALEAVDRAATAGEDLAVLCRDVVELARRVLVAKAAPGSAAADLTPADAEALEPALSQVSVDELIYCLRAFLEADAEMRRSPHPRVELEMAAVRAARRPVPSQIDALLAKVEDALSRVRAGAGAAASPGRPAISQEILPAAAPPPPAGRPRSATAPLERPATERGETRASQESTPPPARAEVVDVPAPASRDVAEAWQNVLAEINRKKALLGSVLQHTTPVGIEDGVLVLAVGGNHFHREMLSDRANRDLINQTVQQLMPGVRRAELDAGAGTTAGSGARQHPAVQAALNVFEGEVVAVRPRAAEEGASS